MRQTAQMLFGAATAFLDRTRRIRLIDVALLVAVAGFALGLVGLEKRWTGQFRSSVEIDLSLSALPRYALLSLSRGLAAYGLSLLFTLVYGYWAAKDRLAEKVLIPLLDILQSIPVLGFMPGVVLALVSLFPRSNVGLELAAVLMIFTGQAWNMTFAYYHSLRSVPRDLQEVGTLYRFGAWKRLWRIELPFATNGLVWNSMMSMAGGWFFLMVSEATRLGDLDFRLPGLGSYMSVAADRGDGKAMIASVVAMVVIIVLLDQLLWRPLVVWAEKFRPDDAGQAEAATSWFLDLLRRSRIAAWLDRKVRHHTEGRRVKPHAPGSGLARGAQVALSGILFALLVGGLLLGAVGVLRLLRTLSAHDWATHLLAAGLTLVRVLVAIALGTLWTVPAGLAIGLSPRLSRILQPVVQVVASFPAPMLFPAALLVLGRLGVSLEYGSVVLMLLGTQWYVLFNVIAGAISIPADLREASRVFRFGTWHRLWTLYVPAVFPYLVTGWVTAAGGAWNASIVSEYNSYEGRTVAATGLGASISEAAAAGRFAELAAAVTIMSLVVVAFNRLVWRRLHRLGEERFALTR